MNTMRNSFQKLFYYPSAVLGLLVVFLLIFTAVYTIIKISYRDAINMWRSGEYIWYQNPKIAAPASINLFSKQKYADSFSVGTRESTNEKIVDPGAEGTATCTM